MTQQAFSSENFTSVSARVPSVQARMMLDLKLFRKGNLVFSGSALNEAVVRASVSVVKLEAFSDGREITAFSGDGMIASTPTGSTAYAFSAGGPIIWPNVEALQLVPLAAHALFARPLVIGSGSSFTMTILDNSTSDGWICCDGRRQRALPKGTRVVVRESQCRLRLARLSGVPFTQRLVTKFDLPVVGWREHGHARQSQNAANAGNIIDTKEDTR